MNNFKLILFALLLLLFIAFIQFKKDLFVLFEEGHGNFTTQVVGETFPKTLIDVTGISYQLEQPPQRILSATLSTDHILADLIDPKRLVAVSSYIDYPSLSNLVGFYDKEISRTKGEIESMLALQPDVVFVASYSNPETVRYLLRSGIAIVRLSEFKSFNDIFNNIQVVATVTDTQKQADTVIKRVKNQIKTIQEQVKNKTKPRVLYYDMNGYSVGGNSLMDESITLSGGINIARNVISEGEQRISEEVAISLQPDVIVMNQWVFNQQQGEDSPAKILKSKAAWQNVPAIKNNRVYAVPGIWLRSVSQHRIKGVEAIAKLLHPSINLQQVSEHVQ
ncbi:ABC transporter substrate-binding protein [Psychromonas sp. Urea-02u-13]|uniref:ABC transporter substrate-binding protein n=1 Tax=Psychromonas sp. Urea-02u-13 TaxID=2058326 RepID=UPI000C33A3B5|nr:ABC transporter substrate-binding protein [Psychromonas sp. Urea-02u-13]PKG37270.1 ABC transporter substrate-binding protein [Psychromonas sp. Urea-02u-13]